MKSNLQWNVFREDFNSHEIEKFDIFKHGSFKNEVTKLKKKKLNREDFAKELRSISMYYFWSKCEHEVVITSWPPYIDYKEFERISREYKAMEDSESEVPRYHRNVRLATGAKVDIYQQLELNWERFVDYVYTN